MNQANLRQGFGRQACTQPGPRICSAVGCSASFEVTEEDLAFYDKVSPEFGGKKFLIPAPKLCFACRAQQRLSHANERHLYHRTCDLTGEKILSIYAQDKANRVYEASTWWSDDWDPLEYGRKPDLTKEIFPQLSQLFIDVPIMSLFIDSDENSPYVNYAGWNKNCHLCFCTDHCEDSYYTQNVYFSKNAVDCHFCYNTEIAYECIDCNDCYNTRYCRNCNNCLDSSFLYDCTGCKDCFGCAGLRQKQYCYFNKQLTEKGYKKQMSDINLGNAKTMVEMREKFTEFLTTYPRKAMEGFNNESCTGNYLFNSHNARMCFDSIDIQDCKYCTNMKGARDCQDINYWGHPGELCYDSFGIGEGMQNVLFSSCSWGGCINLIHSINCISCKDCLCCSGLRHKQYCIFNTQYSKQDYESLAAALIQAMIENGEWGVFIPAKWSPFGYNESPAMDQYPLTKKEVLKRGWSWYEKETPVPDGTKIIPAARLPANIADIPDDILQWAICCEETAKPFKVVKQELDFYRRMKLPIPHLHPDERHKKRMKLRNPRTVWQRTCAKCTKNMQTTYASERPETVYCEECYLKEVY